MSEPTLLVHACCAPCLLAILSPLGGLAPRAVLFYNPNIQPLLEHRRRLKSVQALCGRRRLDLLFDARYDPKAFLGSVPWDRPDRCLACCRMRLEETARLAAAHGFGTITTTLLASVHQDHEAVRRIGEEAAARHGLAFHYADWRPLAAEAHAQAKRLNLYRQQYCGCLFSEQERFAPTRLHLYRGAGGGQSIGGDDP